MLTECSRLHDYTRFGPVTDFMNLCVSTAILYNYVTVLSKISIAILIEFSPPNTAERAIN